MDPAVKKRAYDASGRRQQAEATRQRILDAAHDMFLAQGYARTTMTAVARAAGVSQAAVFAAYGSKAQLLIAVVGAQASGSATQPMRQRPKWVALAREPDRRVVVGLFAAFVTEAHGRTWRLLSLVRAASDGSPDLAAAAKVAGEARRADCAWFMSEVLRHTPTDPTFEGVLDLLWMHTSIDVYRLLVIDRGWETEDYQRHLTATLADLLLTPPT